MNFRNIDRRLFTILMIVFVQMVGAAMVLPILPLYAQRRFALSPQTITLLVSSFFLAQFLAGPSIGRLSDKYGRLPVLIISQIGTAISFVMLAYAQSPEMLFASRILDGITGGNIIVAQAYVTDITPSEQRTQSLGYIFAAFGLGFIIGPALGGLLSASFGTQIPFLLAAVAATATVLLTWITLDETLSVEQRQANRAFKRTGLGPAEVSRNASLVIVLVVAFVGQFALGLLQSTFALFGQAVLFTGYSEQTTDTGIGLLLAVVGLGQLLTQLFLLRPALRRYGEAKLVVIGSVLRTVSMFVLALVVSPWLAAIGLLLLPVGIGVMLPSLQSLGTRTVADELRGGVLGLYQSSISLGIIIGTALGGALFAITPTVPYWIGGMLSVIVILPAVALFRQTRANALRPEVAPTNV